MGKGDSLEELKSIFTFRPIGLLLRSVRKVYLSGRIHLIPFPGRLIFWVSSGTSLSQFLA
jgi:hypothetical protein